MRAGSAQSKKGGDVVKLMIPGTDAPSKVSASDSEKRKGKSCSSDHRKGSGESVVTLSY